MKPYAARADVRDCKKFPTGNPTTSYRAYPAQAVADEIKIKLPYAR
jgi:hypothetical protein